MKSRVLLSALMATSVIAVPATADAAQKRKTLFEVLFKSSHERKQRKRQKLQALREEQERLSRPKKIVKVQTSKNYSYRVVKRAPIKLIAAPVSFALAEIGNENTQTEAVNISQMTADIVNAGDMNMRAEKHLAEAVAGFYKDNSRILLD